MEEDEDEEGGYLLLLVQMVKEWSKLVPDQSRSAPFSWKIVRH